jgi:5'-nucleotidase
MLRVLLTNDDGVRAAGILAIRAALTGVCASVVTVAPDGNRSGFARKCTFDRPVGVRRLEGGPHPVYECDGTPTDCVRAGLLGGLAAEADLVVSGINHGFNVADDVVYSGTVGAGLEAAVLGTSALCLSQQTPTGSLSVNYTDAGDYDFRLAARHGAGLTATILAARPPETVVLSINYPAGPSAPGPGADAPEAVLTRPGQRIYPRAPLKDWDSDPGPQAFYLFGAPDEAIPEADGPDGTDVAALRRGLISVTPLSVAAGLEEFTPAMTSFLARLPVRAEWPGHRP